jgi:antagonist of KipI
VEAIEIIDSGFFTTVQDLGRYGYQRYGVPVSGAMDLFGLRAANVLVGNPQSAAALEITLVGPRVRFLADAIVAITGADLQPQLDDRPLPGWRPFVAPEGAVLSFGHARDGLRAYLAVAGGIDVPAVLGSRSTFTRGGLGGFDGRALQAGDRIRTGVTGLDRVEGRAFAPENIPVYGHDHAVRIVLGPQDEAFTCEGISTFLSAVYSLTPKSDRIGLRLSGPRVSHKASPDIVSDGIPFGAVQVAGDGLPMILTADRGTTGGYTKLATVISADLPRLAQALPGDRVSFREISLAEAHRALREQEAVLDEVRRSNPVVFMRRNLQVVVDGRAFSVALGPVEQGRDTPVARLGGSIHVRCEGTSLTMQPEMTDRGELR